MVAKRIRANRFHSRWYISVKWGILICEHFDVVVLHTYITLLLLLWGGSGSGSEKSEIEIIIFINSERTGRFQYKVLLIPLTP